MRKAEDSRANEAALRADEALSRATEVANKNMRQSLNTSDAVTEFYWVPSGGNQAGLI